MHDPCLNGDGFVFSYIVTAVLSFYHIFLLVHHYITLKIDFMQFN